MITIILTADQEAALSADKSERTNSISVEDYLRELIEHQILTPVVERWRQSVVIKRIEQFEALSDTDKVAVDAILNKNISEK